jgi:1-deoxy-D-xylulose-5-phosphate synthase
MGKQLIVTLEESTSAGGFGSAVLEALSEAGRERPEVRAVPTLIVGVPAGRFVDHGSVVDLRRLLRLDSEGIAAQIREALDQAGVAPPRIASARTA